MGFILGDLKSGKKFESQLEAHTRKLEESLRLDPKNVDRRQEFVKPWYPAGEK